MAHRDDGTPASSWARDVEGGTDLLVHVRPGASRSMIAGLHGEALCVRVRARPVEGAANREVVAVLASALGIRRAAVAIRTGEARRDKRIRVEGLTAQVVRARLAGAGIR